MPMNILCKIWHEYISSSFEKENGTEWQRLLGTLR